MSDNFYESLVLMVAGMGTVFVFLTILWQVAAIAGNWAHKLDAKYGSLITPDKSTVKAPAKKQAVVAESDMSEIAAVLAVAHQQYGLKI